MYESKLPKTSLQIPFYGPASPMVLIQTSSFTNGLSVCNYLILPAVGHKWIVYVTFTE